MKEKSLLVLSILLIGLFAVFPSKISNVCATGITRVQGNARGTSTSSPTITVTLVNTPTIGNVLIATIGLLNTTGPTVGIVSSVTETGVTWSKQVSVMYGSTLESEIWFGIVSSGASKNITITSSKTSSSAIADICEYSGILTSNYLDKTATNSGANPPTSTGTTTTTSQANELWIGITVEYNSGQSSPKNGFTLLDGVQSNLLSVAYLEKIVNTTGAANSGTSSSTGCWSGCIAAFHATSPNWNPPVAKFNWSPPLPVAGESITFDASSSSPGWNGTNTMPIVLYSWDLGDGNKTTGQTVTHTYVSLGIYTVSLNVTDSRGLWDVEQKQISALPTIMPTIMILSPENGTYLNDYVPLEFTNVIEPTSWIGYSLDGQGIVTIVGNTTITGLAHGEHSVIVYANSTSGDMASSEEIKFFARAYLGVGITSYQPRVTVYVDTPSTFPVGIVYNTGDVNIAVGNFEWIQEAGNTTLPVTFPNTMIIQTGDHCEVCVTVNGTDTGFYNGIAQGEAGPCNYSDRDIGGCPIGIGVPFRVRGITVVDQPPTVITIVSPQNTTYPTMSVPLTFTMNEPTSWIGYSLDSQANVTIVGNTTLTGLSEGTHSVIVYANDTSGNMGKSLMVVFTVYIPKPPVANFTWSPSMPKVGETVTFDASSSTSNGGTITKYEWDFGDSGKATGQVVTHAYSSKGLYTVTLNVTDSEGLWDVEQKQIQVVQPHGPKPELTVTPETAKVGELVKFDASSSLSGWNGTHNMPITEYRWDFGDGNRTTTSTPIIHHRFSSSGIYYVTLTVYALGATPETDSATRKITVITIPVGGYSIPIQVSMKAEPIIPYIALMATLTAIFTKLRPKTKRKR